MRATLHAWALSTGPRRTAERSTASGSHRGELRVLAPTDGDTLRFSQDGMTVTVRWTGGEDAPYRIEYRVGEGDYHLEGELPQVGAGVTHGPFTAARASRSAPEGRVVSRSPALPRY